MTLFMGVGIIVAVAGVGQAVFGGWTWMRGRALQRNHRTVQATSRTALHMVCSGMGFALIAVSMLGRPDGFGFPPWLRLVVILLALALLMVAHLRFGLHGRGDREPKR